MEKLSSCGTKWDNGQMLDMFLAVNPPVHPRVSPARTDADYQRIFQQAFSRVVQGQEHCQLVLCLLVMLWCQELMLPGQEPHKPVHSGSTIEEFCGLLHTSPAPKLPTTVASMLHSLLRVSKARARDDMVNLINDVICLKSYPDSSDDRTDAFWSRYLETNDIDSAIRDTIGKGDENASY